MLRTKQLIIVGGPSCSGKTFLLRKIRQTDLPELRKQIGLHEPSSWCYVNGRKLSGVRQSDIDRLVVHYDFLSCHSHENGFQDLHALISNTGHATVLTLCARPETLHQRITSRLAGIFISLIGNPKTYRKKNRHLHSLWTKRKFYTEKTGVHNLYREWFNFFDERGITNQWVIQSDKAELESAMPYNRDVANSWIGI